MRYLPPKRISRGDKVAVVAPASPFLAEEVTEGLDIISEMALVPVLGENVRNLRNITVVAGSREERAKELMWAFSDPSIKGIFVACGGYGSGGVLPLLDFDIIRQSQKALIGMSDISALNNGILAGAGLISINGQSLSIRLDEGDRKYKSDTKSLQFAVEMMMSDEPWLSKPFEINDRFPRTVCPGTARGPAIGMNIDTFRTLVGTPFMPEHKGAILFIEGVHEGGERFARDLLHLSLTGMLDELTGVVIGEFADVPKKTDMRDPAISDVTRSFFSERGVPCVYGYAFSHGLYTIPVPVGADTSMNADTGEIVFNFRMK